MAAIPEVFDQPGAGFVFLHKGIKFPPYQKEWQLRENAHTFQEAKEHWGNVGIIAGNGYIGLDQDQLEAFQGLKLPDTTEWETRPGRRGLWFRCSDLTPELLAVYGKEENQAQLYLYKDGEQVGEVKLERSYQLVPPSWKKIDEQRVDYKMLVNSPPAEISIGWLLSELKRLDITFTEKKKTKTTMHKVTSNTKKAKEFLSEAIVNAKIGNRAKLGLWLACQLRDLGVEVGEASEYLMAYARGVPRGDDPYIEAQAQDAIKQAYSREPRDPPEAQGPEIVPESREILKDLPVMVGEDPKAINNPEILQALANLKVLDPIAYGILIDGLKLPRTAKTEAKKIIEGLASRWKTESVDVKDEAPIPKKVVRVGDNIMQRCDVVKFLTHQAQRNHIGDKEVIEHLLASIASTNSLTSAGIQPAISGERGIGKTDAAMATFHIVPPEWKVDTSISSKTPYYIEWKDGLIVFSDDVEWSPELIHTLKRAMGRFQTKQTHTSLDKDLNPVAHEMACRVAWWLSSVDSVANEQLIDRQYSLDVDDSPKHAEEVSKFIKGRRAKKTVAYAVDWKIEVARYIIGKIKDHAPFRVIIPCADKAEWFLVKDHRTQKKFWDLVEAFAILRYEQRYIDAEGWLYATKQDFLDAKELFMKRKVSHKTKLTNAQKRVVSAISSLGDATQANIAQKTGMSQQAVSSHLKAIMENTPFVTSERGDHGEMLYRANVTPFDIADESIIKLPDDYEDPAYNPVEGAQDSENKSLQPSYNLVTTNLTTPTITNCGNNTNTLQPTKSTRASIEVSECVIGCEKKIKLLAVPPKEGCKVVNSPNASETPVVTRFVRGCKVLENDPMPPIVEVVSSNDAGCDTEVPEFKKLQIIYVPKGPAGEYGNLAFNPWVGCIHGCKYQHYKNQDACYAPQFFHKTVEEFRNPTLARNMLKRLEHDLKLLQSGVPILAKCGEKYVEVTEQHRSSPVFIMFGGDLYSPPSPELPRNVLELFNQYKVPFDVLTKGGTKAVHDFDLYFEGCRFWTTLTFDNPEDSKTWEPGAALPEDRITAMEIAHERGIKTVVSFEPVIETDQTLHLIELTNFADFRYVGKVNHNKELEDAIDWPRFRADAEALMGKLGLAYELKADLARAAQGDNSLKCKCAEDVVNCLDKYADVIKTPVLGEYLPKFGIAYTKVIGQLEARGWHLDHANRIMMRRGKATSGESVQNAAKT